MFLSNQHSPPEIHTFYSGEFYGHSQPVVGGDSVYFPSVKSSNSITEPTHSGRNKNNSCMYLIHNLISCLKAELVLLYTAALPPPIHILSHKFQNTHLKESFGFLIEPIYYTTN